MFIICIILDLVSMVWMLTNFGPLSVLAHITTTYAMLLTYVDNRLSK